MINIPEWVTHSAYLRGSKIYTDYMMLVYADTGKIERVDRSDLYNMSNMEIYNVV